MQKINLILLFLTIGNLLVGQTINENENKDPLNSININFFGGASMLSLNYSRIIPTPIPIFIDTKLGVGYNSTFELCLWGSCNTPEKFITIPHHITGNLGKKRSFLEFGVGGTFFIGDNSTRTYFVYPIIAYRFIPFKKYRVNFRIYTHYPIFRAESAKNIIFVPFGYSIGLSF
jgi:hypothetical protein